MAEDESGGGGGGSASEMEAFIFLFCWSANVFNGKEKQGEASSKKRNHFIADHTVKHISPLGLVQAAYPKLLVILFISERLWIYTSALGSFC